MWGAELVPSRLTGWHQRVSRVAFFGNAPRLPADGGTEVVWTFLVLLLIVTWFRVQHELERHLNDWSERQFPPRHADKRRPHRLR